MFNKNVKHVNNGFNGIELTSLPKERTAPQEPPPAIPTGDSHKQPLTNKIPTNNQTLQNQLQNTQKTPAPPTKHSQHAAKSLCEQTEELIGELHEQITAHQGRKDLTTDQKAYLDYLRMETHTLQTMRRSNKSSDRQYLLDRLKTDEKGKHQFLKDVKATLGGSAPPSSVPHASKTAPQQRNEPQSTSPSNLQAILHSQQQEFESLPLYQHSTLNEPEEPDATTDYQHMSYSGLLDEVVAQRFKLYALIKKAKDSPQPGSEQAIATLDQYRELRVNNRALIGALNTKLNSNNPVDRKTMPDRLGTDNKGNSKRPLNVNLMGPSSTASTSKQQAVSNATHTIYQQIDAQINSFEKLAFYQGASYFGNNPKPSEGYDDMSCKELLSKVSAHSAQLKQLTKKAKNIASPNSKEGKELLGQFWTLRKNSYDLMHMIWQRQQQFDHNMIERTATELKSQHQD